MRYILRWRVYFNHFITTQNDPETFMTTLAYYVRLLAASCLALGFLAGCATKPTQSVSLLEPVNGATVGTTFKVRFGVQGMAVAAAGDIVKDSGHNHLLINRMPVAAGASVPFDDNHRHFGAGQTEAMITLPPGQYKLTSQFANGAHQSYGAPMSASIQITVK